MTTPTTPTAALPHGWTVAGTALAGAAAVLAAWWLSTSGLQELVATGLAFWAMTLARLASPGLPALAPRELRGSAQLIGTLRADLRAWTGTRSLVSQAAIAAGLTVIFLVLRALAHLLLAALSSPILAAAAALAVAAAVTAPHLVRAGIARATEHRAEPDAETDAEAEEGAQ